METLKAIKTRRSIRAFTGKKVSQAQIRTILEAGTLAPSSKNSQPWKFIVIQDKKNIENISNLIIESKNTEAEPSDPKTGKIRKGFFSTIKASGQIMKASPVLILVENTCIFSHNRKEVMKSKYVNAINGHDSEFISLGCAIQNMSLAAHVLGLGSVIIADVLAEEKNIKKLFELKGDLVAVLALGYPAYFPKSKKANMNCVKFL